MENSSLLKFKINNQIYYYDDSKMIIFKENEKLNNISYSKLNSFNSNSLNSINLITNQTCNMNCDYCYLISLKNN